MSALALPMLLLFGLAAGFCVLLDRRRRQRAVTEGYDYGDLDDDTASSLDDETRPIDRPRGIDDDDIT
jgi:hypothetical protein